MTKVKWVVRDLGGFKRDTKSCTVPLPYCGKCGKSILDTAHNFCGMCGEKLDWSGKEGLG